MAASSWYQSGRWPRWAIPWLPLVCIGVAVFLLGWLVTTLLGTAQQAGATPSSGVSGVLLGWLLAAPLIGVAAFIGWYQWQTRLRLQAQLHAIAVNAERMASGDLRMRVPTAGAPMQLRTLGEALNRLADLRDSTSSVLLDRDAQLAVLRSLGGLAYWETDSAGKYTRIDVPQHGFPAEMAALHGHERWAGQNRRLDGQSWDPLRAALARRERFEHLVWSLTTASGTRIYLSENGAPRFGPDGGFLGYVGVMQDVTATILERQRAAMPAAVMRASHEPAVLIEHDAPDDGTCPGAADGARTGWRIVSANSAACQLLERNEPDLQQLDTASLFVAETRGRAQEIGVALRQGRAWRANANLLTRYGEIRRVAMRLEPMVHAGEAMGFAALILDHLTPEIASLRTAVAASETLRREAAARSLDLEVTARELESFSYTVSHDLRAPLRVMEGFSTILREDYGHLLDRMGNEHLSRIQAASYRMHSMIDALLALARLSAQPVVPQPVDLSQLAQSVFDELSVAEPERTVAMHVAPGMRVSGDKTLLRIVLQNLIGNAWKYSARTPQAVIALDCIEQEGQPVFVVSDNGVGFDMRFADRLFGVFQRLHSASEFPGTGVGLATVQRIVGRHGGRVWAESTLGQGSRFFFTLWERGDERSTNAARRTA